MSKFNELKSFLEFIKSRGIVIDIIVLQEVWDIPDLQSVNLAGFQSLVSKCRITS